MRNPTPSTLAALPVATHNLAELEHAYSARRRGTQHQSEAAILAGRVLTMPVYGDTGSSSADAQPTMAWVDGPRSQPRDGRGRFLPRTWLADAELFLPSDRAFFRSPITSATVER